MAECRVVVSARVAIWLRAYVRLLILTHMLTGWAPSERHLERVIARGVRFQAES